MKSYKTPFGSLFVLVGPAEPTSFSIKVLVYGMKMWTLDGTLGTPGRRYKVSNGVVLCAHPTVEVFFMLYF